MKKIDTAINFTEQLLERAEEEDKQRKIQNLKNNKATASVGEGYWPFHLRELAKLLKEAKKEA